MTASNPAALKKGRFFDRPYPVLFLLMLIYACNAMDRHVIALLAEPIRNDLKLSDTQLGLLSGLMFALFYTVFGIPVGWLADRLGRVKVITIAFFAWSLFSAAGAFSASFGQLALARKIGRASCRERVCQYV